MDQEATRGKPVKAARGKRRKEAPALLLGEGGLVGTCEVGEDAGEPEARGALNLANERRGLLVPDPEPAHPRIDLQVNGQGAARFAAGLLQALHLARGRDGGR